MSASGLAASCTTCARRSSSVIGTAVLFCFIFLYLAAAGGGAWSLDALRGKA